MKIVVLDGYTLNPGDISWDNLKNLGDTAIYNRTPAELTLERSQGAEILFTNKTLLDEDILAQLPELKYIGVLATGYNVVDVEAAKKRNISVANIPTYGTASVAQMTFAILLELCNHVHDHSSAVHKGDWTRSMDWCFWNYPLIELADKTMGIIGFGRIGRRVADIATAMGMNVLGFDAYKGDQSGLKNFRWAELDGLLRESDIVSLHCPLSPATQGIINKDTLRKMKKTAFLINTSRGPLVVDEDLTEALNMGIIAGAGLDVLSVEPPKADNPLLGAKNCIITPHISWATKEARTRLMDIAVDNLKAFLEGNPVNVINM
jgi:glycerate dehydrogenase